MGQPTAQSTFYERQIRRRTSNKKAKTVWAQHKNDQGSSKTTPSSNRKATRTAKSPKPQPPPIEWLKMEVTPFRFKLPRANNLVPHRWLKGPHLYKVEARNTPSELLHAIVVQRVLPHAVVWHHHLKAFCSSKRNPGKASTPTHEGDAFGANPLNNLIGAL
jgi:hypothetical protein